MECNVMTSTASKQASNNQPASQPVASLLSSVRPLVPYPSLLTSVLRLLRSLLLFYGAVLSVLSVLNQ